MSNVMASSSKNSSEIVSFMRNVPNSDLTYLLQVLQEKTAQHVRNSVSDINNLVHSVISPVQETSDADLIYRYCAIRKLWNTIENAQSEALRALERLQGRYFCGECKHFVVINYKTSLLNNLKSHTCTPPVASDLCKVKLSSISKEYELYQHVQYDESIKEQLFYKVFVKEKKQVIYFYTVYVTDNITCIVCCCEISGKNNILQHISGNRHIKTLNEYYCAILVYHSYFGKVHPEYQLRQREFCPVDIKRAKCSICKKEVLLSKLEGHLIGPCFGGLRAVSLENINMEYELYQNVHYDENVSRLLFYQGTAWGRNETMYFYSVRVSDIIASCLACDCVIHGKNNIEEHILGSRHTRMLNEYYNVLLVYHQNFVRLNPECQLRQTAFTLVSEKKVNCTVCNKQIPFTKLPNHVVGACFGEVAQDEIIAQYDNLVKTTIYNGLLQWEIEIDRVNYPILQRIENQIYCMVCNKFLNKHVYIHMEGSEHHLNKSQNITKQTLKKYHKLWTAQPAYIQIQQIYFRRRDNRVTCTLCSISLSYESCDLFNHIESTGHKRFLMEVARPSKFEMKIPGFDIPRKASVETDRDMRGSTSSLTVVEKKSIQGVNHKNKPIKPRQLSKSASDLNVEVESDSSESFTVETDERSSFSTSSSTSSIIKEPAKDESPDSSSAKISDIPKLYKDIINILGENFKIPKPSELKNQIMETPDTISEKPKTLQEPVKDETPDFSTVKISDIPKLYKDIMNMLGENFKIPKPSEIKDQILETPDTISEEPKTVEDTSKDQKAAVLNEDESDEVVTKTVESKLNDPLTQPEFVNYSEEVIKKLYGGELIHYYLRLGNVKYPFIQNIPDNLHRCLVCNVDIMGSIIFHINSTPHVQSLDSTEKIGQLKKFHDFWVEVVEEYQHEQMGFDIGEKLTCRFCLEEIEYDLEIVKKHILAEQCLKTLEEVIDPSEVKVELSLVSEATNIAQSANEQDCASKVSEDEVDMDDFAQNSSIQDLQLNEVANPKTTSNLYEPSVINAVYLHLYQYTVTVNDVSYPYMQFRTNEMYCLICRKSMKYYTQLEAHIRSKDHTKRSLNMKCIDMLSKYHGVFTKMQSPWPIYQVLFKPYQDKMSCLMCGEFYPYVTEVVQKHLRSENHLKLTEQFISKTSPTKINKSTKAKKSAKKKAKTTRCYDELVMESIYKNLTKFTHSIDKTAYLYIQHRGISLFCLICQASIENITEHLKQPHHLNRLQTKSVIKALRLYHDLFLSLPRELQMEQIYFTCKKNIIMCVLCEIRSDAPSVLMQHLRSTRHQTNVEKQKSGVVEGTASGDPCSSKAIVCKHYNKLVMKSIYADLTDFTFMLKNSAYLYIQLRHNSLYCLICQQSLDSTKEHVEGAKHLKRSKNKDVLKEVKRFHYIFLPLTRELQAQQVYFVPNENATDCLLCEVRCTTAVAVKNHLESTLHQSKVMEEPSLLQKGTDVRDFDSTDESEFKILVPELQLQFPTVSHNENLIGNWINDLRFEQEPNSVKYYIYSSLTESEQKELDQNIPQLSAIDNASKQSEKIAENVVINTVDNERYEQESNSVKYYINSTSTEPEQEEIELFELYETLIDVDEELSLESTFDQSFNSIKQDIRHTKFLDDIRLELEPYSAKYCVYPSLTESEQEGSHPNMPLFSTINDAFKQSFLEKIDRDVTDNVVEDVCFEQQPNSVEHSTPSTSPAITTRCYDELVMDSIYKHLTKFTFSIGNEAYLYIQHRGASLFCLICQQSIRNGTNHHKNLRHLNRSRSKMVINTLRLYHDFFLRLPLKLQMEQIYFTCKKNIIKCTLCGIRSAASSVLKPHLMSKRHRERVRNQKSDVPKGIDNGNFSSSEAPSTPTHKPNDTSHITSPINTSCDIFSIDDYRFSEEPNCVKYYIYSTITGDYCDDAVPTIESADPKYMISTSSGCYYCFLCERNVTQNHADTKKHVNRTGRTAYANVRRRIDIFLEQWNGIDKKYHHMREEFIPASPTITLCLSCGVNLEYSVLESHLKEHHDDPSDSHVYAKLYAAFRGPPTFYSDGINAAYFFDNVPQCNIIVDTVSYPIFQTTIQGLCCLLCRLALDHSIEHHLSTTSHLERFKNKIYRKKVVKYHEAWCGLEMKYQIQIPYFNNITRCSFNCISCNEKIGRPAKKLRIHMDSQSHRSSMDLSDITGFLLDERQGCPAFTKESLEATLTCLDENSSPIQNSQLDGSYNTDSDSDVAEVEGIQINCYLHTTSHFYPDFDKHYITMEGERYPIFRETICGLVCMICRTNPRVASIEEHQKNNVHIRSMTDERRQKKVKIFHANWAIQSTDVQLHQRYIRGTKCLPCAAEVSYEEIDRHVLSSKHQRKSTLPARLYMEKAIIEEDQAIVSQAGHKNQKGSTPVGNNNKSGKNATTIPKAGSSKKTFHEMRQSVLDSVSSNIEDRIPPRYFQQANYFTIDSDNNAICELCSTKVEGDVISHLYNTKHAEGTYLIPKKMKYFCGICFIQIDTEPYWRSHMTDLKHIARCNDRVENKQGQVFAEYECLTCNLVLYGDDFSIRKHIFGKKRTKELVLPKSVLYLFANRDYINRNLEKLVDEANKAWKNQDKERQVCLALVRVLKEIFPQCKAYPFGSRVTGLGYCDSDLDVFLDTGDMYLGGHHQSANDQALIVNLVAGALKKHKNSFSNINKVAGARTPIVQVLHEDTGIDCDISFKHGLSVENTAFISLCLDMQPILRPAMLYLKEWCITTNITSLSSYALTMLVLFYLQRNGYLLSVKDIRVLNPDQSSIIAGWETIKYTASLLTMKKRITNCDYNVIEFMENFFEYYANFEFEKFVVCPLLGSTLDKALFNDVGQDLPKEMKSYVLQLYPNRNREFFRNLTPMCVQDPFDLSHNLTKACSKDMVNKFKGYCNLSLKHLRALQ